MPRSSIASDDGRVAPIVDRLADEKVWDNVAVVGFGETTHGTREFRELFFQSALRAARGQPELTVALEVDPRAGWVLNESIVGCGYEGYYGPADDPGMTSIGERDFLEQARQYNARGDGCVRVVGVDAPRGKHMVSTLRHYAQLCLSPQAYTRVLPGLHELRSLSEAFGTDDPRPPAVLARVMEEAKVGRREDHCVEFEWWAHVVSQHIAVGLLDSNVTLDVAMDSTVDRDKLMAASVMFWADRGSQVFFLAHAGHVANVESPAFRGESMTTPAGAHLERALGTQYTSVGMYFGEGTLYASGCWQKRGGSARRIPPPRRSCIQADLLRDFAAPTLLSTPAACEGRDCGMSREFVYCVPRGWRDPKVAYAVRDAQESFDWLAFFPHATADVMVPSVPFKD